VTVSFRNFAQNIRIIYGSAKTDLKKIGYWPKRVHQPPENRLPPFTHDKVSLTDSSEVPQSVHEESNSYSSEPGFEAFLTTAGLSHSAVSGDSGDGWTHAFRNWGQVLASPTARELLDVHTAAVARSLKPERNVGESPSPKPSTDSEHLPAATPGDIRNAGFYFYNGG
jgi:hypothetical protein